MKKLQYGRSMIEMLGVLAIIGVLSVGAIAGYQKAMTKYKLNKYAADINSMIMNLKTLHANQREITAIKNKYYVPESLYQDYNLDKDQTAFTDKFGNRWINNEIGIAVRMGGYQHQYSQEKRAPIIKETCPLILQVTKDIKIKSSLQYPKGSVQICNKGCPYTFDQLTLENINEFCDIVINAQNGDAIMYIYYNE